MENRARRGFVTAPIRGIGIRNERLARKRPRGPCVARVRFDTRLRATALPLGKASRRCETNYAESGRRKRAAARNKDVARPRTVSYSRGIIFVGIPARFSFFRPLIRVSRARRLVLLELSWNTGLLRANMRGADAS